jgi:ubiquinone/menaquinone biosynthesis C-methylase UbiE
MGIRRVAFVAGLTGIAAWLAQPSIRRAARSVRTSSAPSIGAYELAAGWCLGGYYRDIARDCAAALPGVAEPSILEIGPGPGHLAERLLDLLPDAHWMGVDVDPAMLDATERRLTRAGTRDRATLVEADVAQMPFPDASFDLVVSSLSAHHWPDAERGFAEIRRVLRPDGRALVYDVPAGWAHEETGSAGLAAAKIVFGDYERTRARGIGPLTIVWRADLRP